MQAFGEVAQLDEGLAEEPLSEQVVGIESYANADKTKTFCIYEGPSEAAVRGAAARNGLPVERVTEVPVDLFPR